MDHVRWKPSRRTSSHTHLGRVAIATGDKLTCVQRERRDAHVDLEMTFWDGGWGGQKEAWPHAKSVPKQQHAMWVRSKQQNKKLERSGTNKHRGVVREMRTSRRAWRATCLHAFRGPRRQERAHERDVPCEMPFFYAAQGADIACFSKGGYGRSWNERIV